MTNRNGALLLVTAAAICAICAIAGMVYGFTKGEDSVRRNLLHGCYAVYHNQMRANERLGKCAAGFVELERAGIKQRKGLPHGRTYSDPHKRAK